MNVINLPTRPILRYHGGKWKLAKWIIGYFPPHRIYVEPFGGAASVLLRKSRCYAEVWNDLDGEVVNLFRVLRNPDLSSKLIEVLRLTPFSRAEFESAYEIEDDPIERARRLIIISFMGFGSNAVCRRPTGFRANAHRNGTTPAHDWSNYPDCLARAINRLNGVVIENRDAKQVMAQHDGPETLHYVDPPYLWGTRCLTGAHHPKYRGYSIEMTDDDHRSLLVFIRGLSGMVVLSGYRNAIYDDVIGDWLRLEKSSFADGARPRTECIWISPAAWDRLQRPQPGSIFRMAKS